MNFVLSLQTLQFRSDSQRTAKLLAGIGRNVGNSDCVLVGLSAEQTNHDQRDHHGRSVSDADQRIVSMLNSPAWNHTDAESSSRRTVSPGLHVRPGQNAMGRISSYKDGVVGTLMGGLSSGGQSVMQVDIPVRRQVGRADDGGHG